MRVPAKRLFGIVLGLLLAVHLVLLGFFRISDGDTWWHLKQGELYVTTRSLPAQDPFAFTTAGREWLKYSWVADILFYLVFRAADFPGLVLLRLLLFFLIVLMLYLLLRSCRLHPTACVLLLVLASLTLRLRLLIRPEILSFLLLLASLAILLRLQAAPPRAAYALVLLQVVWTNVHASFVFGLGLPGLVLASNFLPGSRVAPGWGRLCLDRVRLRHLAVTVACLPIVSLLNPQGVSLLQFPFRQNQMIRLMEFFEWRPVWFLFNFDPAWWFIPIGLGLVLLAFAATACLLLAWEGRVDPVGWGIVLSMGTYATLHNRIVPHFLLAVLPFLALALVRIADQLSARGWDWSPQRLERLGALACVLVLAVSIADQVIFTSRALLGFGVRPLYFPEGAAAFLERHRLDGRVFNTYKFGGYLIWRRWPANQVVIDGRYDGILFEESLLEDYLQAYHSPAALDRITGKYDVEILVLSAHPNWLLPYIGEHPGWARVYWDPVAEVYARRGGRYTDLIGVREYRLTRSEPVLSYLAAYRGDPETRARALTELRRAAADNPENVLAWLGLAQEYRVAGPTALADRLEALTHAATLMTEASDIGRVNSERAEVLLQLGRWDDAKAEAQNALRLQGDLILPRWVLAAVAERHGAWGDARQQLRTILSRLEPSDPRVGLVRERLERVEQNLGRQGDR